MSETAPELPTIRGFLPSTLIDWPGRIASILFLPSCNLRCPYCHAGDLLEPASDEVIPFSQVRDFLAAKAGWIDGVVICGGEPTLHPTLGLLCDEIHRLGFAVKLDTNGTRPEVVEQLINERRLEAVSMDVKTTLDARMVELARCEVDLEAIDRTISLLLEAAKCGPIDPRARDAAPGDTGALPPLEVEFRTTCCPAFVDEEVVEWIARRISRGGTANVDYVLQRFEPEHCIEEAFRQMKPYSATEMEHLLEAARRIFPRTRLRGG